VIKNKIYYILRTRALRAKRQLGLGGYGGGHRPHRPQVLHGNVNVNINVIYCNEMERNKTTPTIHKKTKSEKRSKTTGGTRNSYDGPSKSKRKNLNRNFTVPFSRWNTPVIEKSIIRTDTMGSIKCINCGVLGHTMRTCEEPNFSYGVILFRFIGKEIEYLLMCRKESYAMGEFLSERYNLKNIPYMVTMFNGMTVSEREDLRTKDILEIEEIYRPSHFFSNKTVCNKAYSKYERLIKGYEVSGEFYTLSRFLNNTTKEYSDPEWGFPKGKKMEKEEDLICAQRELEEETNFTPNDYTLLSLEPYEESIIGENKKNYKYYYYVGMVTNYQKKLVINRDNCNQEFEVSKLEWYNANDAANKFRSYYPQRKNIITTLDRMLKREFFGISW
jgi:8-oxo-dGTP pyrophosphatase MutT (NUDIX family)